MTICFDKDARSSEVYFSDTDKILYLIKEFGFFRDEHELACIAFIGKTLNFDTPIDERKIDVRRKGLSEPSIFMNLHLLERGGYIENSHKKETIKLRSSGIEYLSQKEHNGEYSQFVAIMKKIDRELWPILSFYLLEKNRERKSSREVLDMIEDLFELEKNQLHILASFSS